MSRRFAFSLAALPLAIALGAFTSRLLFDQLSKPAAVADQPVAVVTGWGPSGALAWLIYFLTMSLATIPYLLVVNALRAKPSGDRRTIAAIVVSAILALVAAFAFRFLFSSDVYAYAAYGAFVASGMNPYQVHKFPPTSVLDAGWTAAIGFEWPSMPACVYGPAFVEMLRFVVIATHENLAATIAALRLLAAAAFIASVVLLPSVVRERGALLAGIVGLNPIILSTVADGHYDMLVFFAVACGVLVARARPFLGGLITGASTLLKATGVAASLALSYVLDDRRFSYGALVGTLVAIAVQIGAIVAAGGLQTPASTDWVGSKPAAVAVGLRGLLALIVVAIALYNAGIGARARTLAAAAMVIWILNPISYPWYAVWLLPLAAFTREDPEGPALLAVTFCSPLRYLSDAYGYAPAAPWLGLIAVAIPTGVLAWRLRLTEKTLLT